MNSFLSRIRVVSFIVLIISIIFCCGYAYADESIAQAFVLTEENEIKGVSKYIDYIKSQIANMLQMPYLMYLMYLIMVI